MNQNETPTSGNEEDTVEIHLATDDELADFLNSSDDESDQTEEQPDEEEEIPAKSEAPQAKSSDLESRIKQLEEENSKLKSQSKTQEKYIGQRSNEIGELRKQLKEAHRQIQDKLDSEEETLSPREVAQLENQLGKIAEKDQELAGEQEIEKARETVSQFVQPWQTMNEDILFVLTQVDGIPEAKARQFLSNPYSYASGTELVHLMGRARLTRVASDLHHRNQELEAQLKGLGGKVNPKAAKAAENLTRANEPKVSASGASRAVKNTPVTRKDIAKMTDAELSQLLAKKA